MKKILLPSLAILATAAAGWATIAIASPASTTSDTIVVAENVQTLTFNIEKMTCAACPITVKKAMKKVEGVNDVAVNYDAKTATVSFDPAVTSAEEIAAASTNAGYPASVAEAA